MPPLQNFSDNPLCSRLDLVKAAIALIKPLDPLKSSTGARIKLSTSTGAGFSETAAQLEGFARPLWVVAELMRLKSTTFDPIMQDLLENVNLESWVSGLKEGTDPQSKEYWGDLTDFDQRMVEMETVAFALLVNPSSFSFASDPVARANLIRWLRQINDHTMPQNNWLWFRVLVNLALTLSLGLPMDEVRSHIDDALEVLDTFYIGDGWSSDGLWGNLRKQADYYSGSFAIQFAQCLFVRFASCIPEYAPRIEKYKEQAKAFASEYWRYFDTDGVAIPFGRSLTYRFAFAAFWGALSFANIPVAPPLSIGSVKGLLLRHLRWWAKQPHIFNTDGTQNIGYCYLNMYMAEEYNSPQSVYWCLKSFLVLGLDEEEWFWKSKEEAHPMESNGGKEIPRSKFVSPPKHILVSTEEHHFLLSSGQSTTKRFKAREAKYAKFAYSSAFGFSVPCGPFLEQIAPDSTLAVSWDDGEENWKVRWEPYDIDSGGLHIVTHQGGSTNEQVPTLTSKWMPWKRDGVVVKTTLVAPSKNWPGWHVRMHQIRISNRTARHPSLLRFVDSGFSVSAQTMQGASIVEKNVYADFQEADLVEEGWWNDGRGSLVISEAGASGVADLTKSFTKDGPEGQSIVIRADPNTNIVAPRTLIPAVQHCVTTNAGGSPYTENDAAVLCIVTGVFAIRASATDSLTRVWDFWNLKPTGRVVGGDIQLCLAV